MTTLEGYISKDTNIVLITAGEQDRRKFIVWNIEGQTPVEVLSNLFITRIAIENQKKIFEHPLEDGATITDYSILEAKKANIQAYISADDTQTLGELERLYLEGTLLRIRAENKIIENVIISAQPFEISGGMIDKSLYSISLTQAQFVIPQYVAMPKAKKKSNISKVNSGIKQAQGTDKKAKEQSWLLNLFKGKK